MKWLTVAACVAAVSFPGMHTPALAADNVTGAGASFPAPVYARWAADYNKTTGHKINYQSIGSSAGLRQIEGKTVDFGASDAPLTDAALQEKDLIQFPMLVGGIVPIVNIKGIAPGQLKLNGQLLGDIYLGKITRWNDPAIAALNPGLSLPAAHIAVVRRADGSGATFALTDYLSRVHSEWKQRIGTGAAVKWPVGLGGKGNEGMAAFVKRINGAIGYVEFTYVKRIKLAHVQLQNRAGKFVHPSETSFKAAASGADWEKSFHQILTDQPGDESWPITAATFIVMHKKQDKSAQAAAALNFFAWAFADGDAQALNLGYVPMPQAVKDIVMQSWQSITDASGKAVKP
jgi:phosphate transport system substrate-binding protein